MCYVLTALMSLKAAHAIHSMLLERTTLCFPHMHLLDLAQEMLNKGGVMHNLKNQVVAPYYLKESSP